MTIPIEEPTGILQVKYHDNIAIEEVIIPKHTEEGKVNV